jgi:MSHA biogenesis protein MshQ
MTPNAPFNAEIALALNVIDTDGVAFAGNPASFGTATAGNGIAFNGGKGMRFGVLKLDNAHGSELLPLRVPMRAMYWNGSGWVTNADDSCTTLPNQRDNLAIGNHLGTLTAGNYGSGKVPSAALTLGSGRGTIVLAAPNAGTSGSADIALNLNPAATTVDVSCNTTHPPTISGANLPWLQGKWGGSIACPSTLYDRDPSARIKFGSPKAPYIYLRERY